MRKILSVLLACIMVFTANISVFAESSGFNTNLTGWTRKDSNGTWTLTDSGYLAENKSVGYTRFASTVSVDKDDAITYEATIDVARWESGGLVFGWASGSYASYMVFIDKYNASKRVNVVYISSTGAVSYGIAYSKDFTEEILAESSHTLKLELTGDGHATCYFDDRSDYTFTFSLDGDYGTYSGGQLGFCTQKSEVTFNNAYMYCTPSIKSILVAEADLNEEFDLSRKYYSAEVESSINKATISARVNKNNLFYINDSLVSDPTAGKEISLLYGNNQIELKAYDEETQNQEIVYLYIYRTPGEDAYNENLRAQLHFSPSAYWMNDPNGLVYNEYTGEYHMFYQHHAKSMWWDNYLGWGHAVSTDLVNWQEKPMALHMTEDVQYFSGSAVIDINNTSGFFDGSENPENNMILFPMLKHSDGKSSLGIVYSQDGGNTFTQYDSESRILSGIGDPRVFFYEDETLENGGIWLLFSGNGKLYSSENLLEWAECGSVMLSDGKYVGWECQDIYPLPLDGDEKNIKWVYNAAGSWYVIGDLVRDGDSFNFTAETEPRLYNGESRQLKYADNNGFFTADEVGDEAVYATQSFNGEDGRRISVSWLRDMTAGKYEPAKKWNGFQSVAMETTLKTVNGEATLISYPVEEINDMRSKVVYKTNGCSVLPEDENILSELSEKVYDIEAEFEVSSGVSEFGFTVRSNGTYETKIAYDTEKDVIKVDKTNASASGYTSVASMPLSPDENGKIKLRILVDNSVINVFGNDGEAAITSLYNLTDGDAMSFYTTGAAVTITDMKIYRMDSIWKEKTPVLNNIIPSVGEYTEEFDEDKTEYILEVANEVDSIAFTPVFRGETAVMLNGAALSSGVASEIIALSEGENKLEFTVTKADSEAVVYTVSVNRAEAENTVTVTIVTAGGNTVEVNGKNYGPNSTQKVFAGEVLKLKSEGDGEFLFWIDYNNNTILSYSESYNVTVGTDRSFAAVYSDKSEVFVTFTSMENKLISSGVISAVKVPDNPYVYGYSFNSWYVKGGEKVNFTPGTYITVSENTEYIAGFTKDTSVYNVNVNGTVQNVTYNEKLNFSAETEKDGKVFSYWKRDGVIVSYDTGYSFYVNGDTTLEAIYGEPVERNVILAMAKPVLVSGNKIAFFAERDIADDYRIIETGILIGTNQNLALENAAIKAIAKSVSNKGQYTVRKTNVKSGNAYYGVAYAILLDQYGNVTTVYSNEVSYKV